jgi:peptidyl-tRNA hydrolase
MPPGKLAAQAGHAFVDTIIQAQASDPALVVAYHASGHGIKVCLNATSEFRLLAAHEAAKEAGLPCAIIVDRDHVLLPHFNGSPIITALGIGPARKADICAITKKFNLV